MKYVIFAIFAPIIVPAFLVWAIMLYIGDCIGEVAYELYEKFNGEPL